jgi:ankyrin repeat protein
MVCFAHASVSEIDYLSMSPDKRNSALCIAVKKGSFVDVQKLIGAGADINQDIIISGTLGRGEGCMDYRNIHTLLEYAAMMGYLDILKELIKAGAKINQEEYFRYSDYGPVPLIGASINGHAAVVKELLKAGVTVNKVLENKALCEASMNGHAAVVKELLKVGVNINYEDSILQETALFKASSKGHLEVVRELIKAGFDVNHVNHKKSSFCAAERTALIEASYKGHLEVVKELIKAGAQVNFADKNGDTALINASNRGHSEVVKELIQANAQVNLANKNGDTALMFAIKQHNFDVVQTLLLSPEFHTGAWKLIKSLFSDPEPSLINYADKNGDTALILAVKSIQLRYREGNKQEYAACLNSQRIVEELLKFPGIDHHHVNKKGETALTLLKKLGIN